MADGQLEIIWSKLYYATRTLSPVRLVLEVTLFLLMHCTGVFLCFWELELELIQTQMAQKPMLRAEVYAHAMRASQNRKKGSA